MPLLLSTPTSSDMPLILQMSLPAATLLGTSIVTRSLYPHTRSGDSFHGTEALGAHLWACKLRDPSIRFLMVTDTTTNEIISWSMWHVYTTEHPPLPLEEIVTPEEVWPGERDRKLHREVYASVTAPRSEFLVRNELPIVCLHAMGSAKGHWRRGAASLQLEEMLRVADGMGAACTAEGSIFGRWLYERHNFRTEKTFVIQAQSPEFAELGSIKVFLLTRDRVSAGAIEKKEEEKTQQLGFRGTCVYCGKEQPENGGNDGHGGRAGEVEK